jgi:uncharacterized membrane protein
MRHVAVIAIFAMLLAVALVTSAFPSTGGTQFQGSVDATDGDPFVVTPTP